jgi:hypothetical protein
MNCQRGDQDMKIDPVRARWTKEDVEKLLRQEVAFEGFRVSGEGGFSWHIRGDAVVSATLEPDASVQHSREIEARDDVEAPAGEDEEYAQTDNDDGLDPTMLPVGFRKDDLERAAAAQNKSTTRRRTRMPGETDERP